MFTVNQTFHDQPFKYAIRGIFDEEIFNFSLSVDDICDSVYRKYPVKVTAYVFGNKRELTETKMGTTTMWINIGEPFKIDELDKCLRFRICIGGKLPKINSYFS